MTSTESTTSCQCCQTPIASDAPEGLCPRCLLVQLYETQTQIHATSDPISPPPLESIAEEFPQLEVLEYLGQGSMGIVFKARQKSLNRQIALKLLSPERADDPKFAHHFEKEAQTLATLNHPNIVTIHDFGKTASYYYLLMEFVDGVNLRQAMGAAHFTPAQALAIIPPICEALQFAHDHQIIHRDIKPENILLDKNGDIKIADFGIARILEESTPLEPSSGDSFKTLSGGTPGYMAPEQSINSNESDHRVDIYATGVVLYELLTGEAPSAKLSAPSQKIQLDVRIDEIVLKALKGEPDLRYHTAADFRTRIESYNKETTDSSPQGTSPTPKKSNWTKTIERVSNKNFHEPTAIKLLNWSAFGHLGFLSALSYLSHLNPVFSRCAGFAGFFGLFGLIGLSFYFESLARSKRLLAPIIVALIGGIIIISSLSALSGYTLYQKFLQKNEPEHSTIKTQDMNIKDITKKATTVAIAATMATSSTAEELKPVEEAARIELKEQARERMRQDRKEYSRQELGELEELYQIANKNWKTDKAKAKKAMEELIKDYKKANRTGCAVLYLGQLSHGDERDKYLDQAIKKYSDCYYGNGVQVGGWARYLRILDLRSDENHEAADKLEKELRTKYNQSISHGGLLLLELLKKEKADKTSH